MDTTQTITTTDRFGTIEIRRGNRLATISSDGVTFRAATFFDHGEWGQSFVDSREYKTERGARRFAMAFIDRAVRGRAHGG